MISLLTIGSHMFLLPIVTIKRIKSSLFKTKMKKEITKFIIFSLIIIALFIITIFIYIKLNDINIIVNNYNKTNQLLIKQCSRLEILTFISIMLIIILGIIYLLTFFRVKQIKTPRSIIKDYKNQSLYTALFKGATDAIFVLKDGIIIDCNESSTKMFECSKNDLIKRSLFRFSSEKLYNSKQDYDVYQSYISKAQSGIPICFDWTFKKPIDNNNLQTEVCLSGFDDDSKNYLLVIVRDISERIENLKVIKSALKEKDNLLKEIHHRIKNNLQVITSLINLQSRTVANKKALAMFKETQNRITSIALIHEKLYRSGDLSKVDFEKYVYSLTNHLFFTYKVDMSRVKLELDIEKTFLGIEIAISCGLIINECISNSIKYAFEDKQNGIVSIYFRKESNNKYILKIKDDGKGLPVNIESIKEKSLGFRLITLLTKQLGGDLKIITSKNKGLEYILEFPPVRKVV